MTKAIWNGIVVAQSADVVLVENQAYFPPDSITADALQSSSAPSTHCYWKGDASYFDVHAAGEVNHGAAWSYPEPYQEASVIAGYIAFWKGVVIEDKPEGDSLFAPSPAVD